MSRLFICIAVLLVLVLSFCACSPVARGPLQVVERDTGCLIDLQVGGRIELVLNANPSAGCVWEIVTPDIEIDKPVGEAQFTLDSAAADGSGKLSWVFEAVAPGEDVLRLVCSRPVAQVPSRTFEVYLAVR
jgi:predicted secreted protein